MTAVAWIPVARGRSNLVCRVFGVIARSQSHNEACIAPDFLSVMYSFSLRLAFGLRWGCVGVALGLRWGCVGVVLG